MKSKLRKIKLPLRDQVFTSYARLPLHRGQNRLLSWMCWLLPGHRVTARTLFGFMRLDVNDAVQRHILTKGAYEPDTVAAIRGMLNKGGYFVDVGAHIGQFSLLASKIVGDTGRVVSIEPNPQTFTDLEFNLRLNEQNNVSIVLAAVSDRASVLRFEFPPANNRGASREASEASEDYYSAGAFPLSDILATLSLNRIDVLKIDVEGGEFKVLKHVLESTCPRPANLVFEFLPEYFSYTVGARELLQFIEGHGYTLHTVGGKSYKFGDPLPDHNVWAQSTSM